MKQLKSVAAIELSPRKPFDLHKTLCVYSFHWFYDGVRGFIPLFNEAVAVVEPRGEKVAAEIYAPKDFSEEAVRRELQHVLGIEEDLSSFFQKAEKDPLLRGFAKEFVGWRLRAQHLWWSLVIAVCQQNASFRQGWKMLYSLIEKLGKPVRVAGREVVLPPTPRDLLRNPSALSNCGLGYRAATVLEVAKAFTSGSIAPDEVGELDAARAEEKLVEIRGVGRYTARLSIALSYRKYDLPPIDRWVEALASQAYGVSRREVADEWVRRWGKWSALAVFALTIALDAAPMKQALQRLAAGEVAPKQLDKPTPNNMWRYSSW